MAERCPGSGLSGMDGRFPGDKDRCPVCCRNYVKVLQDGTLASHTPAATLRVR